MNILATPPLRCSCGGTIQRELVPLTGELCYDCWFVPGEESTVAAREFPLGGLAPEPECSSVKSCVKCQRRPVIETFAEAADQGLCWTCWRGKPAE